MWAEEVLVRSALLIWLSPSWLGASLALLVYLAPADPRIILLLIMTDIADLPRVTIGMLALACCLAPVSVSGFSMTAPPEHVTVVPGQSLAVTVDLGNEVGLRQVRYSWYRAGEEPLNSRQDEAALVGVASSTPPFGGILTVPPEAIGLMRLLAVGEIARGRLDGHEEFDEILIRVEPSVELVGIEFESHKPWRLRTIGRLLEVPVVGEFADGVRRPLGGSYAGSTYASSNDRVVKVYPGGLLRVMGNGQATITVTNRGVEGTLDVLVRGDDQANEWPTADAGPDVTVRSGDTVALNALQSIDPDGDPLRYEWTQIRGNKVSFFDANTPQARFVAPRVSSKRLFRFRLRVTDMAGPDTLKGADSLPSFVNIWVEP